MRKSYLLAVIAGASSAFPDQIGIGSPMAKLFPDVPAFASLQQVGIGIAIQALRHARPGIVDAPYVGAIEVIARDTVRYRVARPSVPQSSYEDQIFGRRTLNENAAVDGIDAWETQSSQAAAELLWRTRVTALERRNPGSVECFQLNRGGLAHVALASRDSLWVGIILYDERTLHDVVLGYVRIPAALDTFAATRLQSYVPGALTRKMIRCP